MRRLMVLATGPLPLLLGGDSQTMVSFGARNPLRKQLARLRPPRNVATHFQQYTAGTAHDREIVLPRCRHRPCTLAKQKLCGNHRSFCLAVHRAYGAAHQHDLLQGPFVGPEKSLVFPPPTIAHARHLPRQLMRIFHSRKQPYVHLMATNVNPQQASANGWLSLVLLRFRPVVDDPFAELIQRFVGLAVECGVGGHADEKGHLCQDHGCGDLVPHISRIGHQQRRGGQPSQHLDEVTSFAGFAAFAQSPAEGEPQRQMHNGRIPDHRQRSPLCRRFPNAAPTPQREDMLAAYHRSRRG